MAAIIGSVAAMNDFLASYEEDDDLDDIFCHFRSMTCVIDDRIKCKRYYETTIRNYLPDSFKRFFKINRETLELLCRNLALHPTRTVSGGRPSIPLEKKLLMTVRYLASQETICELSDRFGILMLAGPGGYMIPKRYSVSYEVVAPYALQRYWPFEPPTIALQLAVVLKKTSY
ncbi:uncharacterized protein LOC125658643 [Ostrea edulis]|uniref:uncharacterized protein LOC125658643 n=1 Tax=Ostrea edulis TaxID=37623 RepID=UPI0024AEEED6|nr:uncharacterized protein LOC125658643 [Ostrea edulis]